MTPNIKVHIFKKIYNEIHFINYKTFDLNLKETLIKKNFDEICFHRIVCYFTLKY